MCCNSSVDFTVQNRNFPKENLDHFPRGKLSAISAGNSSVDFTVQNGNFQKENLDHLPRGKLSTVCAGNSSVVFTVQNGNFPKENLDHFLREKLSGIVTLASLIPDTSGVRTLFAVCHRCSSWHIAE